MVSNVSKGTYGNGMRTSSGLHVLIPGRKDKWGKRFGFAQIKGVRVKVADDQDQRLSGNRNIDERISPIKMQGFVHPRMSYAQAVLGIFGKVEEVNEGVRFPDMKEKRDGGNRGE
ncbi:hypothetical protein SLEP1_g24364 [Rubroshorea leprosula]|uniref:Uncharacterized protein n=1 Tax=Rubroshorea leprosula TaxID=152421 RepID=A0AAV5JKQ2_9ROSI|nr:hypothetical protein SLEP1_g24364 [Rubroshorea leprosula]